MTTSLGSGAEWPVGGVPILPGSPVFLFRLTGTRGVGGRWYTAVLRPVATASMVSSSKADMRYLGTCYSKTQHWSVGMCTQDHLSESGRVPLQTPHRALNTAHGTQPKKLGYPQAAAPPTEPQAQTAMGTAVPSRASGKQALGPDRQERLGKHQGTNGIPHKEKEGASWEQAPVRPSGARPHAGMQARSLRGPGHVEGSEELER